MEVPVNEAVGIIKRWLAQKQPFPIDFQMYPDSHLEYQAGRKTVEAAIEALLDQAGGKAWILARDDKNRIPDDLFHNVGGWLRARANDRADEPRITLHYQEEAVTLFASNLYDLVLAV